MPDRLVLIDEMAKRVGVSVDTARYWHATGYGPKGARIGRRLKYRESDIDAWINEQFSKDSAPAKK